MKNIGFTFLLFLGLGHFVKSQVYLSKNNEVSFFSKTPLEDINATNKHVSAVLNCKTMDVVVKIKMQQFEFPNKLMQEHFNENYMESEKFPDGTFIGKISETIDFTKEGSYTVNLKGVFSLHGVAQNRMISGILMIKKDLIQFNGDFEVALADHKIEVPKLVLMKIAEKIKVKTQFKLLPFTKK